MSYYNSSSSARHSSGYDSRPRGYRVCDNCGVEESSQNQLKLCSRCKVTQYCGRDCQKSHWRAHEPVCRHTQDTVMGAYNNYDPREYPSQAAEAPADLSKHLRKFTSAHSQLLAWAGFQALELKRVPANIRRHALLIDLSWRGGPDPGRRFEVNGTRLVPLSILNSDPVVVADIQRREDRCRRSGGIGAAVVLLQCGRLSEVMPVEVDSPAKIPWATTSEWEDLLSRWIDHGAGAFQPP
ncbi:hypothetical protein M422DRAFT_59805 [Sphaerobolus stellatus SS14]|uniref:MYND-type domain-containing protein n=1 Tax=Sphaerobolus stellatus (strain SS14) TaxID=990650 RepID=A0A0C9W3C5_SPHS4|nr:hypothetical protein M422DRAFT_59805 [Sphaerobolus stellatus SS14]